jgi:hypothetical protein
VYWYINILSSKYRFAAQEDRYLEGKFNFSLYICMKFVGLYIYFPLRLNGVVFYWLSMGTILPFYIYKISLDTYVIYF